MNEQNKCCQEMLGWRVVKTADVKIPKSTLIELEHIATGARYIHLASESKENVFAVALKTIPDDSTGVAHILEHTVLTGSKKYPVRDPFFSMIKRSLQTFMNAFTANDWTAYPFASPNKKDFYNLMSVYLDAVFFPNLSELNFMQEGWRYSLEEGKLKYEGVVYNEMKGVMSSPERNMEEALNNALYNEAPYHYNTGGDPAAIPELTYGALKEFHAKFYHPSNALFFSYGNLPLEDNLRMVNENVMAQFGKGERFAVKAEERWKEAEEKTYFYPVAPGKLENKHQIALAWLMCPVQDNLTVFSLELLDDILLDSNAAPLRKALLDSGLGSDLCDCSGYDSEPLDTKFVIGLKDAKKEDADKIRGLIFSTLEKLISEGIDEELIDSVIASNETRKRNESNQPYPIGLQAFLDFLSPYLHGGDAAELLDFEGLLQRLREKVAEGKYFEGLIKKYFLGNSHCVFLALAPDDKMFERLAAEEERNLARKAEELSEADKKGIEERSLELKRLQSGDGDLSCLPSLEIGDIEKAIETVQEEEASTAELKLYRKNTNGLLHFVGEFDLMGLDSDLVPYAPLFANVLTKMGNKKRGYEELAKLIDKTSGGISLSPQIFKNFSKETDNSSAMVFYTYCLAGNIDALLSLIKEVVADFDFSDLSRIKMLLGVMVAEYESVVVEHGHSFAMTKAVSPFSQVNGRNETWSGLDHVLFSRSLKEKAAEELKTKLVGIGEHMASAMFKNIAIISEGDRQVDLKEFFVQKNYTAETVPFAKGENLRVAYPAATSVSFVAAGAPVPDLRHEDAPALSVLAKLLARGFLHNEIREKRGAYGGFVRYDSIQGNWCFGSYRDPHIASTLEVFGQAKGYILGSSLNRKEIEEAIISVSADLDRPATEVEQAKRAFSRCLMGLKDEDRRSYKERLLQVAKEDLERVAGTYLKDNWHDYSVAVISSADKIKASNEKLKENFLKVESEI